MSSNCPPASRAFVVRLLAAWKNFGHKVLASRLNRTQQTVAHHLRSSKMKDWLFNRFVGILDATQAEVAATTAFHETLSSLARPSAVPGLRDFTEMEVLWMAQQCRSALDELEPLVFSELPQDEYPQPCDVAPARWRAAERLKLLKSIPQRFRLKAARTFTPLHTWAMVEAAAEESVQAASRSLKEAFHWARVARQIAKRVQGPEGWRNSVRSLAVGAFANAWRVAGRLFVADRILQAAKRLQVSGYDPDEILDPGRLLDFEASLRRAQRRFPEALDRLGEAFSVSHRPARVLVKKGFTLEVMGDHDQAVKVLLEAEPLVEIDGDSRLRYQHRFNLAVLYTHAGRFAEAAKLADEVQGLAESLGDEIFLVREIWLRGRVASGRGLVKLALQSLEQAEDKFSARGMWFDVALALLERESLLLEQGRKAEVKAACRGLIQIFEAEGVHCEALAALRLFFEAAQGDTASAELARSVLRYLFRARHDESLAFSS